MQQRQIKLNGMSADKRSAAISKLRDAAKQHFNIDLKDVDAFVSYLIASGWDAPDIESAEKQASNSDRPAVQAATLHNQPVFDELLLTQGTYTDFRDTAADPNYAIRHRGQAELILRRLSPGNLLLLQAAQMRSYRLGAADSEAHEQPNYWQNIWGNFESIISDGEPPLPLTKAVAAGYDYILGREMYDPSILDFVYPSFDRVRRTFMDKRSIFYTGVCAERARTRSLLSGYRNVWTITHTDDGLESLAKTAVMLATHGIDNHVMSAALKGSTVKCTHGQSLYSSLRTIANKIDVIRTDTDDGNQETNIQA